MNQLALLGGLLKKNYRAYSLEMVAKLQLKGFLDLRPSFLEILVFLAENDHSSIKLVGDACGLKKQTMTGHLRELEKRGYLKTQSNSLDRREVLLSLTPYGEQFKVALGDVMTELESEYIKKMGSLDFERLVLLLEKLIPRKMDK